VTNFPYNNEKRKERTGLRRLHDIIAERILGNRWQDKTHVYLKTGLRITAMKQTEKKLMKE